MSDLEAGWYELLSTRRSEKMVSKACFRIEPPDTRTPWRDQRAAMFRRVRVLKRQGWHSKLHRIDDEDFSRAVLFRHLTDDEYIAMLGGYRQLKRKLGAPRRMAEVFNELR